MHSEERLAITATAGLAVAAIGTFLPWARIGGRPRSGYQTADTFIRLADGALPDWIAWVGRWWYLPAALTLVAWCTVFLGGRWAIRATGIGLVVSAAVMWWSFVWAGDRYDVLDVRMFGPVATTIGLVVIACCCARARESLLASPRSANETADER